MTDVQARLRVAIAVKVNLYLRVGGVGADGYHGLSSLVVSAGCGGQLTLHSHPRFASDNIVFSPDEKDIPIPADNTITRMLEWFRQRYFPHNGGFFGVRVRTTVPTGAGFGVASAQACALLTALCEHRRIPVPSARDGVMMGELARRIGADVPACLARGGAWVEGIGDRVRPVIHPLGGYGLVLAKGVGERLSTGSMFASLGRCRRAGSDGSDDLPGGLAPDGMGTCQDAPGFLGWLRNATGNDFEPLVVARFASVAREMDTLQEAGSLLTRVSGSGAGYFGVFPSLNDARDACQRLRAVAERPLWCTAARILPHCRGFEGKGDGRV